MKPTSLASLLVIVAVLLAALLLISQVTRPTGMVMRGSLFASDAGRSHGGFEYNAEWNATLTISGSSSVLKLVLSVGLGDALQKHEYRITDFEENSAKLSMKIEGHPVVLVWQANDIIWNHIYDRYYVASWGSEVPPEEIRGAITPLIFPGLAEHYYVELRLR